MENKKLIRKEIFARRKHAEDQKVLEDSRKIMETVMELEVWKESACIYAYMDFNHEVMTGELIQAAWRQGKQVAVPKVHGKDMTFYLITDLSQCSEGYFKVPEPSEDLPKANAEDALMIVPGVAFDRERHRVGYGQGYYDRYLEFHNRHKTVAVAFSWQLVDQAPHDEKDVLPQYLVTEKRVYQ